MVRGGGGANTTGNTVGDQNILFEHLFTPQFIQWSVSTGDDIWTHCGKVFFTERKSIINFNFSFYSLRTSSPLQRALQWISILLLFYWSTVNKINQVFSLSLRQKIKERVFFCRLITSTQETGTKTKPENQSFTTAKAVESDQKTFVDEPQTTVTPSNHF